MLATMGDNDSFVFLFVERFAPLKYVVVKQSLTSFNLFSVLREVHMSGMFQAMFDDILKLKHLRTATGHQS